jgi:6-phosphogluconolactonase
MILYAGSFTEMISGNFGGHGEGIYCFDFDPVRGSLQFLHLHAATNPSYLCIPSKKYLYTHTEVAEANKPRVQAFKINEYDFSLQLLNEQEIPGGYPCHINFSKRNKCILVTCYETANTIIFPVEPGGRLLPHAKVLRHEGSSVNRLRQESPHPHAVMIDEIFNNILVTDLGIDSLMVYRIDSDDGKLTEKLKQEIKLPPGSGPRHIALHSESKYAYVLNELSATVTVMRYCDGDLKPLGSYPTFPKKSKAIPGAAAIRISGNGEFIYISERGDDCIAVLRFDRLKETIEIIGRQKTMGKTPRDISLDPTGNWLLAANQDSDSVAIFKVDKNTGMIIPERLVEDIKSPICLEWLPVT